MAGMIHQLLELLNEQAARYEELLGLSREKRDAVVANDLESLQKITHLENLLASQTQKLERKRLAVTKDIALVLNKREHDLSLNVLIEAMDGQPEQEALAETGRRIRTTLAELSDINENNAALIQNALDYVEYSLNIIRSSVSQSPAYYTAKGDELGNSAGIFDARH